MTESPDHIPTPEELHTQREWTRLYETPIDTHVAAVESEVAAGKSLAAIRTMLTLATRPEAKHKMLRALGYSETIPRLEGGLTWRAAAAESVLALIDSAWDIIWQKLPLATILDAFYALGSRPIEEGAEDVSHE